jgi:hypothetical protein
MQKAAATRAASFAAAESREIAPSTDAHRSKLLSSRRPARSAPSRTLRAANDSASDE